jgi:lipopolysaccharide transport system permease protein
MTRQWFPSVPEAWASRDVAIMFGIRDLRLRYRQTAIGLGWVVLQPLLTAGAFTLIFGVIARLPSQGQPYFVFSTAGSVAWAVFASTITRSAGSLVGNANMISKVYFPRVLLPLSIVIAVLADFVVGLVFVLVLAFATGTTPGPELLLLPVWLLMLLCLALGPGLVAGAVSTKYRDAQFAVPLFTQFLLYVSPVGYAVSTVPDRARIFFDINPLTGALEGFRWSLLGTEAPSTLHVVVSAAAAVGLVALGMMVFSRYERRFADVI